MERRTKFCINCGAEIDSKAEICPKCGVRVAPPPVTQVQIVGKSPVLALMLSFFIPGLGQIYNGEGKIGIFFIFGAILCAFLAFMIFFSIFLYLMVWGAGMYDAYTVAQNINKKLRANSLPT